ncbi:MAG: InlB B-repeat-containing protein, partial [Corallococcus sp.]|nr:InlB B-repeat-containing protein [Corallococcus sp.]
VFVADITYKYDVKFMADGKVHNTQIVEKHAKPTVPSNPTKTNYVFVGWSIDGTNTVASRNSMKDTSTKILTTSKPKSRTIHLTDM